MRNPAARTALADRTTALVVGESRRLAVEFMLADIQLAMVMLDRAGTTNDAQVMRRNVDGACRAFEVVASMLVRLPLDGEQRDVVSERLGELSDRLENKAWQQRANPWFPTLTATGRGFSPADRSPRQP